MDWYIAPLIKIDDPDPENVDDWHYCSATDPGSGLVPHVLRGSRQFVHREAEADVLVCVPEGTPVPADWVQQTVAQAQAHFTTAHPDNRAPTAAEVS